MLEDEEEIGHKFIHLGTTSIALLPELFNNKKLTCM